jgi:hypothetical protein
MCMGRRAMEQDDQCPGLMGLDDAARKTRPRVGFVKRIIKRVKDFFSLDEFFEIMKNSDEEYCQLQEDTMDFTDDDWKRLRKKGR